MDKLDTFTSTGKKLLRQGSLLQHWKNHVPIPHSLQVAPTEKCNLKCKFCSVSNRSRQFEFRLSDLIEATKKFLDLGTKTVEITGGGDPLCYPDLGLYLKFLRRFVQIGLITNGIGINRLQPFFDAISWIRISANVFDYTGRIDIPEGFKGTLGFSYVWTEGISTIETLERIREIAIKNNVQYIRMVPNCIATKKEQEENNMFLAGLVSQTLGAPFFFQPKNFDTPHNCYWGYLKPFLYADGYVYPCSSTVLNPDADRQFNSSYRLCHWTETFAIWKPEIKSLVDTKKCEHCVFTEQNKTLEYTLNEQEQEEFI